MADDYFLSFLDFYDNRIANHRGWVVLYAYW